MSDEVDDDAATDVEPPPASDSDAALARRAQILATEHWGLLAARGTTQSEVLTRISIYLTLVSAGLLTIGLIGQANDFAGWFAPAALSILAFLLLIGLLTQVRVYNAAEDDMMFVVAMNRLRGAYIELDPGAEEYFLQATSDDIVGMQVTYSFLRPRSDASQLLGGSAFLITVVNGCVAGLLGGGIMTSSGAGFGWALAVGALVALLLIAGSAAAVARAYRSVWSRYAPRRMTAELPGRLRRRGRRGA